jgi:hypothetical protein
VKKLVDRNTPLFFNVDKASLFYLPIVLADFPPDMMVSLSQNKLAIESASKVSFYSDIDCLQILFQEDAVKETV